MSDEENNETPNETPSPKTKRQAVSPPVSVKEEPRNDETGFPNDTKSPTSHKMDPIETVEELKEIHPSLDRHQSTQETIRLIPGKVSANSREGLRLYPRFTAAELDVVSSSRLRSLELLSKIFPSYSNSTLELILEGCRGNLVEAIECILSTQDGQKGALMPINKTTPCTFMNGCSFSPPAITHPPSFIHNTMPRNMLARPPALSRPLVCSPPRGYPSGRPIPPPLLVKPKAENPFARPEYPLTPPHSLTPQYVVGLEKNQEMKAFCTNCGHKSTVFDKFCANCGKSMNS